MRVRRRGRRDCGLEHRRRWIEEVAEDEVGDLGAEGGEGGAEAEEVGADEVEGDGRAASSFYSGKRICYRDRRISRDETHIQSNTGIC